VLGTPKDDDRKSGMGVVVEYAGRTGSPRWIKPSATKWEYTVFRRKPDGHESRLDNPACIREGEWRQRQIQSVDDQWFKL